MKVLVIEEEQTLINSIKSVLCTNGFSVDYVKDGISGLEYATLGIYDLIICDVMLPFLNGYELIKRLRMKHIGTPLLMLTTDSCLEERIKGLDSGADYCLTKAFDKRELLSCIYALLRRQGPQVNELSFGNTTLDLVSGTLSCEDKQIRLSAKEFDVMRLLMQAPKSNLSKSQILSHVWGYDSNAVENHVEVYVGFLRKKLHSISSNISIVAIRKLGYHLEIK